jgi:hypothetical protein
MASRRSSIVAKTQILKKLQLLQEIIGEEDIGDEVIEVTISKLLNSTHSWSKIRFDPGDARSEAITLLRIFALVAMLDGDA